MSRDPKPYWKKQQKRWVCTIDSKRITLGARQEDGLRKIPRVDASSRDSSYERQHCLRSYPGISGLVRDELQTNHLFPAQDLPSARREMSVELKTAVVWSRFFGEESECAVTCGSQMAILV